MKNLFNWINNLFDSKSTTSSKRFGGIALLFWSMMMGSFYILKIQIGGVESNTTVSMLEFGIVSAVSLLAGGTLVERLGKTSDKKDDSLQ